VFIDFRSHRHSTSPPLKLLPLTIQTSLSQCSCTMVVCMYPVTTSKPRLVLVINTITASVCKENEQWWQAPLWFLKASFRFPWQGLNNCYRFESQTQLLVLVLILLAPSSDSGCCGW
jgi:hypothetical protein